MRALIVGYGSIARRHLDNLRALGLREFLVYRPAGRPGEAPADLQFTAGIAEALHAKPDLAVIASPSASHIDALAPLLEARIPCYVEKPPVTEATDIQRVRTLVGSVATDTVTLAGYNFRFLASLRRLREELRAGLIGQPVRASLQAGQWLPDWRPGIDYRSSYSARAARGGGVIFDLIHEIDLARWFFGEFDQVRSLRGKFSRLEIDSEDTAYLLLGRQDGGPIVGIGLDYVSRRRVRRYEVVGEEGSLTWDLASARLTLMRPGGEEILDHDAANFDVAATYMAAMREFVLAVKSGGRTSQALLDGLASTALALRARTAS
jgi:predicted dehydrogenase